MGRFDRCSFDRGDILTGDRFKWRNHTRFSCRPEGEKTEQQKEKSMTMTKAQALKTLVQYNNWRRNNDEDLIIDMPPPKLIGQALDFAIAALGKKEIREND